MKKVSYFLFPVYLLLIGLYLLVYGIYETILNLGSTFDSETINGLILGLALPIIGSIIITARASFIVDGKNKAIIKRVRILGFLLSKEKITVPGNGTDLLIRKKNKRGTGYYRAAIPYSYRIESYDLFLRNNGRVKKIICTNKTRAQKFAGIIHEYLNIEIKMIND